MEIKIAKTPQVRTDLEVEMLKRYTRLWREAPFSKSKRRKHTIIGTILEAEMFKKCTPLWREAHLDVKMMKKHMFGPLLDIQAAFCVARAMDSPPGEK